MGFEVQVRHDLYGDRSHYDRASASGRKEMYQLKIDKLEVTFPCDLSGVLEDVGGVAILHTLP